MNEILNTNQSENDAFLPANTLAEDVPEFDPEKARRLRNEYDGGSTPPIAPPNDAEVTKDKEYLMVKQQREDMSVLLSFCSEKDAMDILYSDEYGKLLENQISLMDLFNANALFDEQYFADGYTRDDWRYDHGGIIGIGDHDNNTKLGRKKNERQWENNKIVETRGWLEGKGDYEAAHEYYSKEYEADKIRARDAKETINNIAIDYFSLGNGQEEADRAEFKAILKARANGEDITDGQKEFLTNRCSLYADRLLYDGHVIDAERAASITYGLEYQIERYNKDIKEAKDKGRDTDTYKGTLVSSMIYAESVIGEFEQNGRPELIQDAKAKLSEMVDEYFGLIVSTDKYLGDTVDDPFGHLSNLVLEYSNPYKLVERARKYDLVTRYGEDGNVEHYGMIDNADIIVDRIAQKNIYGDNTDVYLSYEAKDLKEFGASDDVIMEYCANLHPVDFIDAGTIDGTGARLIEAGIDRQKILNAIFCSGHGNGEPFEKQGYPFNGESYADVLERNGFTIDEIVQTFSPDDISAHLNEFLDRGADAKELMKYMMSYREEFNNNFSTDGETVYKMWFEGFQDMTVWDKNHPEGRKVNKQGMATGNGVYYVAANFDKFAEYGVSEEDILSELPDSFANPDSYIIPEMVRCSKFDTDKVLQVGYDKMKKYLNKRLEDGNISEEYVKVKLDQIRYVVKVFEQVGNYGDELYFNPIRDIRQNQSR